MRCTIEASQTDGGGSNSLRGTGQQPTMPPCDRRVGRFHDRAARVRLSLTIFKQLAGEIGSGRFFSNRRSDDMIEPDVLSSEIGVLMALQRDAWRELASPELTQFDRREIRNRIRQGEVDLRGFLQLRTERLRFQPRPAEAPIDSLATINFRFF
jgi:hypothetical protein